MGEVESFLERGKRKRREEGLNWTLDDEREWLANHPDDEPVMEEAAPESEWDDELIPDPGEPEPSQESREIDDFLSRLDIVDAYNRWAGKGAVHNPGGKREGVMIRCPDPQHPDHNPSAWINLDEQVYVCGGCGMQGGDKFMIAAFHFGIGVPIPRDRFPELKKKMAQDLGYHVTQVGSQQYVQPVAVEEDEPEQEAEEPRIITFPNKGEVADDPAPIATVHSITPTGESPSMPVLNWEHMVHAGTFLEQWMKDADDFLPSEYYFWLGLMAIGLAAGWRGVLYSEPMIRGNLFICLVGPTGVGKSRSASKLTRLLKDALPYDHRGIGVKLAATPGSGEVMIDQFNDFDKDITDDPITGQPIEIITRYKVTGMVEFKEFDELIIKASRHGSVMKTILTQIFDGQDASAASRAHGESVAREPFASLLSTTQPAIIGELLAGRDVDSGFLNRWLFIGGEASEPDPFEVKRFDPAASGARLRKIHDRFAHVGHDDQPVFLDFSEEAKSLFRDYHTSTLWPLKNTSGNDLFIRADLMIKKFALLLALDRHKMSIDRDCVVDALQLWEYCYRMYEIVGAEIGVRDFNRCKQNVHEAIAYIASNQSKDPTPIQLIKNTSKISKGRFSDDFIEKVIDHMVRVGEISEAPTRAKDGASTTMRYRLARSS